MMLDHNSGCAIKVERYCSLDSCSVIRHLKPGYPFGKRIVQNRDKKCSEEEKKHIYLRNEAIVDIKSNFIFM